MGIQANLKKNEALWTKKEGNQNKFEAKFIMYLYTVEGKEKCSLMSHLVKKKILGGNIEANTI